MLKGKGLGVPNCSLEAWLGLSQLEMWVKSLSHCEGSRNRWVQQDCHDQGQVEGRGGLEPRGKDPVGQGTGCYSIGGREQAHL